MNTDLESSPETSIARSCWRACWGVGGGLLALITALTAPVPGVPTVLLALLSGACLARASKKLERALMRHRRLGPALLAWRRRKALPRRARKAALVSLLGSSLLALATAPASFALGICLVLMGSGLFVATRPSTRQVVPELETFIDEGPRARQVQDAAPAPAPPS